MAGIEIPPTFLVQTQRHTGRTAGLTATPHLALGPHQPIPRRRPPNSAGTQRGQIVLRVVEIGTPAVVPHDVLGLVGIVGVAQIAMDAGGADGVGIEGGGIGGGGGEDDVVYG